MSGINELEKKFKNPAAQYRSFPFWAWNDKLDPNELVWQIESMKAHGIGGFFMHSREGLETEYMGSEWMECIKASVEAGKKNGMYAWLYDEDRWPSGTAGGKVPAESEEFRAKGLTIEVSNKPYTPEPSVQALFSAQIDDMALLHCERLDISKPQLASEQEVLLVFRIEVSQKSAWFNNQSPPDNLNPNTVRRFIKKTYEAYKEQVGLEFGNTIPGIFTDEPGIHDRTCRFASSRGWLPWTYCFPSFFQERRGYDIFDTIPYIFFNGKASGKARHDYWWTVTELFSKSYTRQLYEWCDKNGLAFTGHFLWENNLGVATRVCGAIMPNYRFQHIPGIDMLNNQTDEYITLKQCTSVANQYGRKKVVSETYGCTGWDFDFEGQKWIGDFQFVMGVNIRCQHLALYSLRGCRKRDYPPAFNYNTTWWKHHHVIEDYFSRLSAVLTEGEPIRDILIIHPSTTAWCMLGTNPYGLPKRGKDRDIPSVKEIGDDFNLFIEYLMGCHYDFDLGDELILAEAGSVQNGKLYINQKGYRLVIIPSIKTLLESTVQHLQSFLAEGGKVITVKPCPTMVSGVESNGIEQLITHENMRIISKYNELNCMLNRMGCRSVSIRNRFGEEVPSILAMLKDADAFWILFTVNNDRKNDYDVTIELQATGDVQEWRPLDGSIKIPEFTVTYEKTQIEAHFGPVDSHLYIIKKEANGIPHVSKIQDKQKKLVGFSWTNFSFTRTLSNSLVLDRCRYRMLNDAWSRETDVWKAQNEIRKKLGMRPIYLNDILPQRYTWIYEPHEGDRTPVCFEFTFQVNELPESILELVVEKPEWFHMTLNGIEQKVESVGWFIDKALQRIPLTGVEEGTNVLCLYCDYSNFMEIEDCYIIGDFALNADRAIIHEPKKLMLGDWNLQGYLHYAGSMVYHFNYLFSKKPGKDGGKILLEMSAFSAVNIEIRVNGKTSGFIPWRAQSVLDITNDIIEGENHIEIEVVGSPRNFFGPFHQTSKSHTVNSSSFRTDGDEYTPEYVVKPYGLFEPVRIYIKV